MKIEIPDGPYDYESSAEALVDAFQQVSDKVSSHLGLTGYQHSWAEMSYLAKSRNLEAGGILMDFTKVAYPQYDLHKELDEAIQANRENIIKFAKEQLEDTMADRVREHMTRIANGEF